MKSAIFAAAALTGAANARRHAHAEAHALFQARGVNGTAVNGTGVCVPGCTTIWTTIVGEPTWAPSPLPPPPPVTATATPKVPVPTAEVTICPTTGVFTIPAKTIVVTETQSACAPETTVLTKGTNTYGGVVTVVDKQTVVTCPYAAQETNSGVVTEVVKSTVITCPSAGTCTAIPPTVTVVEKETTVIVRVVKTFAPGTYTAEAAVVTVTQSNYVYVCPTFQPSTTVAVVAPTPTPAAEKPKEEVKVKVEETKVEAPKVEAPKVEESKKVEVSTSKAVAGGQFITYTAYFPNGDCKPQNEVTKDLKTIKGLGLAGVRIYSTDCNMIETVGSGCAEVGLKLDVGIFINQPGCHNSNPDVASQISTLKEFLSGPGKSLVRYVVAGNEAIFGDKCTPLELKNLIGEVKKMVVDTGCGALVTTVETTNIWERKEVRDALLPVVDVPGLNAHAFFNGAISASGAGKFVVSQIEYVKQLTGSDKCYVGESGWPKQGAGNGAAKTGVEEQKTAIKSIIQECGEVCTLMTFGREGEVDGWKFDDREKGFSINPSCISS